MIMLVNRVYGPQQTMAKTRLNAQVRGKVGYLADYFQFSAVRILPSQNDNFYILKAGVHFQSLICLDPL